MEKPEVELARLCREAIPYSCDDPGNGSVKRMKVLCDAIDPPEPALPEVEVFDATTPDKVKHRYVATPVGLWCVTEGGTVGRSVFTRDQLTGITPLTPKPASRECPEAERLKMICLSVRDAFNAYERRGTQADRDKLDRVIGLCNTAGLLEDVPYVKAVIESVREDANRHVREAERVAVRAHTDPELPRRLREWARKLIGAYTESSRGGAIARLMEETAADLEATED